MISIPTRFKEASLKDWEDGHILRRIALKYFLNFEEYYTNGMAPAFFGTSGAGKSRIAAAILNTAAQLTTPAIKTAWFPTSEALNKLLDYRDLRMYDNYNTLWNALRNTDMIVLDDIGTLRNSPRVVEYFWMIVDARYSEGLPTMYTGNLGVAENANLTREQLLDHLGKWISPSFARRVDQTASGLMVLI